MDMQQGTAALLQVTGVGKMKPNILLLGYKNDWQVCEKYSLDQYFAAIQLVLLVLPIRLDFYVRKQPVL